MNEGSPNYQQRKVRVALFQPVLSHYRVDLFNEMDRQLGGGVTLFTVDATAASRLGGAESRLTASRARSRTFRAGPVWFVPQTLRVLNRRRWDVVIVSWNARQVEILPALLLARLRGVPVILWGHGFGRRGSRPSAWLRRLQVSLAAAVVTYSDRGTSEVLDQMPGAVVRTVANTTGRTGSESATTLTEPRNRVVYLGRLLDHKRGERLIEAIGLLRSKGMDLSVDVVGDGPHRVVMEEVARRLDVDDLITWHGHLTRWDDVRLVVAGCDLVALPSHAGLAVVDGFAVGRGAVVLDDRTLNPPEADLVVDGETGFVYAPATAQALAERLAAIYEDPESISRVSKRALDLYRSELTVEVAAATFRAVIADVLEAHRRS